MPKVFLSSEEREINHFTDFVRGELRRQSKTHKDLARELGLSRVSTTNKINGRTAWTLSEVITTLYFLDAEYALGKRK